MNKKIEEIKPQKIWKYFSEVVEIPRPSEYLEKISEYIINFAKKNNLEYKIDKIGNILIKKPAKDEKFKNKKTIILQAHLDMVPEKEDNISHDFKKDKIKAYIDNGWVTAKGTTLGADNGIGIAGALAVLASDDINHGPIEVLFTIDEEIGLIGATNIDKDFITKDAILLNLDSEDDGQIFISSAGGFDIESKFRIKKKKNNNKNFLEIKLSGMKGGHSGCDIHLNNGNAIITLIDFLDILEKEKEIKLINIKSGSASNAIPRSAIAEIIIDFKDNSLDLDNIINNYVENVKKKCDCPELKIEFKDKKSEKIENIENKKELFSFLRELPIGVLKMSETMSGLVETSGNLASIKKINDEEFLIIYSGRSSVLSDQKELSEKILKLSEKYSVESKVIDEYFGWEADLDSEVLKISKKVYKEIFNKEPQILAIHAGLECGILKHIYPKLDIISFGPTIKFPHSPDEKIEIKTVENFWKLLKGILEF